MAQGIDIKIGSSFDASGITEANKSLAKLAQDVGSANQQLRQATLKAASDINSYAEAADKACSAMGGGYKDASQFVKDAMGEYLNASKSVKQASGAFDDFNAVMRRAAEAVDKRNANIKQAAEVSQVLEKKQRELAAITDTSSEAYKRASRNVEILKQALSSLGVKASGVNKPVEAVPSKWRTALSSATGHVKGFASAVGRNLMNIQAGFNMAARAVQTFVSVMSKGMEFERMTVQFKSLTGSMELAKAHMRDLQDLGRTPPFSLEQFAAASQAMMKMTGGALGYRDILEKVGDVAAATGNNLANMGQAVGRAYSFIRDGAPIMTAVEQLRTMGVVTHADVAAMTELQKAGADNITLWGIVEKSLEKYSGAMAETEKTTKGIVEAIQGEATVAMTEFSAAVADAATPALGGLLSYLKRINEDGTIEDWADDAVAAFERVAEGASAVLRPLSKIAKGVWGAVKGSFESVAQAGGNAVGTLMGGGSIKDAAKGAWSGYKQGWTDAFDMDGAEADYQQTRKQRRAEEKKRKREEQAAAAEAEAQRRIAEDMARAQEETDRKAAEKKAQDESDAAKKAEAERLRAVEAERKAREKMEAELHAQRVANAKAELRVAQDAASSASSSASNAQTEFDRAFAMYRSEDKGAAQIAEERDYAADYKQLKKDAARYGGKWRIDELSNLIAAGDTQGQAAKLEEWRKSKSFTPEVESMVRAAAADDAKTTAEDELRKIAKNTESLSNKLDELLQVK